MTILRKDFASDYGPEHKIDMNELVIGRLQVRQRIDEEKIKELAKNIEVNGQLFAILLTHSKWMEDEGQPGKYEIVAGQSRFKAMQLLGAKQINAKICTRAEKTAREYKADSLSENMMRSSPSQRDKIDTVTFLWNEYGDYNILHEETGIPFAEIKRLVKYPQLAPKLKNMVDEGLDLNVALKAQHAAVNPNTLKVDEHAAVEYASNMKTMTNAQRDTLVKKSQANPSASSSEIVEEARKQPQLKRIDLHLLQNVHERLLKFKKDGEHSTIADAAIELIDGGLADSGY